MAYHHRAFRSARDGPVLRETPALIEQTDDTGINNPVVNLNTVPARGENAAVDESLELIRHGLRLHLDGRRQLGHAHLRLTNEGVQQAKARGVRESLERGLETPRLGLC